jgi:hypothetical protein
VLIVIGLTSWPSSEVDVKLCHTQKLRQLFENNIGEVHPSERKCHWTASERTRLALKGPLTTPAGSAGKKT